MKTNNIKNLTTNNTKEDTNKEDSKDSFVNIRDIRGNIIIINSIRQKGQEQ